MKHFNLLDFDTAEFDYNFLIEKLKNCNYANPRDKIGQLLRNKEIIRIKKGLYILGDKYKKIISLEVLANTIYGPSYISKESALAFYGLIPERNYNITSMTTKKNKTFITPLANYIYEHLSTQYYHQGINLEYIDKNRPYLIASKEKALFDRLLKENIENKNTVKEFLIDGLRIESNDLKKINLNFLKKINKNLNNKNISNLILFLMEHK